MAVVRPKTIVITTLPCKRSSSAMSTPTTLTTLGSMPNFDNASTGGPRKRRRLTHLSQDERMMRRKLKNRVAAQTARDRKKAHMTILEEQVAELESENHRLQKENALLKAQTDALKKENGDLKQCIRMPESSSKRIPESAALYAFLQKKPVYALLMTTTAHFLASLLTMSLICSLAYSSKSTKLTDVKLRLPASQPLDLSIHSRRTNPHIKWWGRKQQNWNPSMN